MAEFPTNIEKVAEAITALTYSEMVEVGASLRDIISDRISDKPDALSNAIEVADLLHGWAAAQLVDEEEDRG